MAKKKKEVVQEIQAEIDNRKEFAEARGVTTSPVSTSGPIDHVSLDQAVKDTFAKAVGKTYLATKEIKADLNGRKIIAKPGDEIYLTAPQANVLRLHIQEIKE